MRKWIAAAIAVVTAGSMVLMEGCQRYEPIPEKGPEIETRAGADDPESGLPSAGSFGESEEGLGAAGEPEAEKSSGDSETPGGMAEEAIGTEKNENAPIVIRTSPERTPVKVKGIYVSAYVAGSEAMMDEIIRRIDETELNAVVIDVKDDNGRVTFDMDEPAVQEIGACVDYIPDMAGLAARLKEHNIYMIARIPAFRDPYLADARPEWCCRLEDGSIFRDRNKLAWVNPYKTEVWDYLIQIAKKAGEIGFDEIQFDYIRFCTEKGMNRVVFEEADTKGRSRQEIILEFAEYAYDQLTEEGLFVSADVFGAVIGGGQDAEAVGQDYRQMAGRLDYICPMIYPSHYGDGNFGIPHPDTQPYDTILGALTASQMDLAGTAEELASGAAGELASGTEEELASGAEEQLASGAEEELASGAEEKLASGAEEKLASGAAEAAGREVSTGNAAAAAGRETAATVRPWLQDFTASYLKHYIKYGPEQVRQQIQAVYDAGYEEWILWSAAVNYHYDGLLPAEEEETAAAAGTD